MRNLMCDAVPDCIITGYEPLVEAIQLPDTGDRHVVAAAVKSDAQAIVTFNMRDFPNESIGQYHLEAIHPDDFFVNQIDLDPIAAVHVIRELAEDLRAPPRKPADIVAGLEAQGLVVTAARLRALPIPVKDPGSKRYDEAVQVSGSMFLTALIFVLFAVSFGALRAAFDHGQG